MSNWASLVYGRTYEVDFRFITIPDDFTVENKDWAWDYIRVTTRTAENLANNPRWVLFKNECHCVVGVTCMVRELIGQSTDKSSENLTKDSKGRPLYIFIGYVAKVNELHGLPPIMPYGNLDIFKPLYDYVRDHWLVKSYEAASKTPFLSEYRELSYSPKAVTDFDRQYFTLNTKDVQSVDLWPDLADARQNLWIAASEYIVNFPDESMSLCLGLANQKDASSGPFLNVTATSIKQKQRTSKFIESPMEHREISQPPSTRGQANVVREAAQKKPRKIAVEPVELMGVGIGAWLVSRIAGIPGLLIGGGIGWIAAGSLTGKGIGGKMVQKTRQLLGSGEGTNPYSEKRQSERSRRYSQFDEQEDLGYGFRSTNKKNRPNLSENSQGEDSEWF
ncbi:hypothetical protein PCC9214_05804 [Planktothrix tepida]|uniref:Uncharacterized protein n=1 Tax=Planktothrix tepida PCC 9214 TaxID=671072 RepID=A0A1J1LT55_9CYAN|nr:hypothetical protein [Planktothrix tepida]CAD5990470.1 hypothetical protein PCC9214_05804 [Planktothrix tepida]CUR35398.1 conserved hypothetical protein [Planktothrix tepida PCC 9214]